MRRDVVAIIGSFLNPNDQNKSLEILVQALCLNRNSERIPNRFCRAAVLRMLRGLSII
jgi:hypothetical protein